MFLDRFELAFDFDGVIADSMPTQHRAWQQAVREVMGTTAAPQISAVIEKNLFAGKAGRAMFDGLDLEESIKAALRAAKDRLWDSIMFDTPLFPRAADIIPLLTQKGRLAIATSTPGGKTYVNHLLGRVGLGNIFNPILTNADVQNPKPAPDMLFVIATHMGITCQNLIMIGDATSDATMARAAQCPFIHFASHCNRAAIAPFQPMATVSNWDGLMEFLRQ